MEDGHAARHAILPSQQFPYTTGKNSTDITLVIDAMDLLHSGRFDGFCLVSSDSDFTRLAARIREQGIDVYGIGQAKTPESFRQACTRFIFTENFAADTDGEPTRGQGGAAPDVRGGRADRSRRSSSSRRMPRAGSARHRRPAAAPTSRPSSTPAPSARRSCPTWSRRPAASRSTAPAARADAPEEGRPTQAVTERRYFGKSSVTTKRAPQSSGPASGASAQ